MFFCADTIIPIEISSGSVTSGEILVFHRVGYFKSGAEIKFW